MEKYFLTPSVCDGIVKRLTSVGAKGKVAVSAPEATEGFSILQKFRDTDYHHLNEEETRIYAEAFIRVRPQIESFFNVRLKKSDGLQALGYSPGCKYMLHADNCDPVFGDGGKWTGWKVTLPHRVISMILFLTDSVTDITGENECVGGHVTFNYLMDENTQPFRVVPNKGLLVAFPSTPLFSHEVHAVTEGYRISLVEWFSASLIAKITEDPRLAP